MTWLGRHKNGSDLVKYLGNRSQCRASASYWSGTGIGNGGAVLKSIRERRPGRIIRRGTQHSQQIEQGLGRRKGRGNSISQQNLLSSSVRTRCYCPHWFIQQQRYGHLQVCLLDQLSWMGITARLSIWTEPSSLLILVLDQLSSCITEPIRKVGWVGDS